MNLEGVDYTISQSSFNLLFIDPVIITVTLLNDGVAGEDKETITLTLATTRSESNEILVNEAVTITLLDNDSMWLKIKEEFMHKHIFRITFSYSTLLI